MGRSLRDRIESLPPLERLALKGRAKAVKDALLAERPDLCLQPYEAALTDVCQAAAWREREGGAGERDAEIMAEVRDMFEGLADRADVLAIRSAGSGVERFRQWEEGYRALAATAGRIVEEGACLGPRAAAARP